MSKAALDDYVKATGATRAKLDGLPCDELPPWSGSPKSPVDISANCTNSASREWDPPIPFHELRLPAFPVSSLPAWSGDFVTELAAETQTPPDLGAMVWLSAVATAQAQKIEVEVKRGYVEPVNLYTTTAMEPGNRKSPVFRAVVLPLEEHEQEEAERMAPLIAEAETRYKIAEARLQKAQQAAANADRADCETKEQEALVLAGELRAIKVPTPPRLIADDTSAERLATLLRDNQGRIGILSAEGDIFEIMAGRYSNGAANFAVFLKGHSGDAIRVDRVGRPPEFIGRPALTMGLTVQPEVLRGLLSKPAFKGRGLLGRLFYSIPTSLMGRREMDAPLMSPSTKTAYHTSMKALLRLAVTTDDFGNWVPNRLTLTIDAEQAWTDFGVWLEPQLGPFGELGHMTDWAGKLAGGVARLAGLLHVADVPENTVLWESPVEAETMKRAIAIGKYLLAHAQAAYAEMGADPVVEDAKFVLGWIHKKSVAILSQREIFEGTKGRFKKVAALEPVLALLIGHGFLREVVTSTSTLPRPGRKPSPTYEIHPSVLQQASRYSHNSQKGGKGAGPSIGANSEIMGEPGEDEAVV